MAQANPLPERIATELPKHPDLAVLDVDDPYGQREFGKDPPKIRVLASFREDPLLRMYTHGDIQQFQYVAGRKWQGCYESLAVGAMKAVNTMQEPVDGGGRPGTISDVMCNAIDHLGAISRKLGEVNDWVLRKVLAEGRSLRYCAERLGWTGDDGRPTERNMSQINKLFHDILYQVAEHFNLASTRLAERESA